MADAGIGQVKLHQRRARSRHGRSDAQMMMLEYSITEARAKDKMGCGIAMHIIVSRGWKMVAFDWTLPKRSQ